MKLKIKVQKDSNFLPNIKCPFCKHVGPYTISGFSGELSIREKECLKCHKVFNMIVYSFGSIPEGKEMLDGSVHELRDKIKWLKQQRKKVVGQLLLEYSAATKLHNQALEKALEMAQKKEMN